MPIQITLVSTVFLSAFLLFLVQPLISRYLLPWFGGAPAVWSAAILFFQTLLMAGYAYAHAITRNTSDHLRRRIILHACLLGFALIALISSAAVWGAPLLPDSAWKPPDASMPLLRVLTLLLVSVGLPYFVLTTTSPLLQSWAQRLSPGRSPYYLYALSNLGSFLALAFYPLLFEPFYTLQQQGWLWAGGYLVFSIFSAIILLQGFRQRSSLQEDKRKGEPVERSSETEHPATGNHPSLYQKLLWITLPAVSSILLLAVTNQLTQEIAVIPFLWVLPMGIYLLSFTLTFAERNWYRPMPVIITLGALLLLLSYILENLLSIGIFIQITIFCVFLLTATVFLHGELYQSRPADSQLTSFYLMISAGSVAGAVFVNLAAQLIFNGYWELQLGMLACWILVLILLIGNRKSPHYRGEDRIVIYAWLLVAGLVGIITFETITSSRLGTMETERNFYGILRVRRVTFGEEEIEGNMLSHGATTHGYQFIDPDQRNIPTAYFGKDSGVGLTLTHYPDAAKNSSSRGKMKVGIVGLGAGTLAAYGKAGDEYVFYEINPQIIQLANNEGGYFTYLQDSLAEITTYSGDGRLLLEKTLEDTGSEQFDVLILDAFSSDSIPVHLITVEALNIYLQHLKPGGVIAVNISNRYLDLSPLIQNLADINQQKMAIIHSKEQKPTTYAAVWALLTTNQEFLEIPQINEAMDKESLSSSNLRIWTDSYSNLLPYLHMESVFNYR